MHKKKKKKNSSNRERNRFPIDQEPYSQWSGMLRHTVGGGSNTSVFAAFYFSPLELLPHLQARACEGGNHQPWCSNCKMASGDTSTGHNLQNLHDSKHTKHPTQPYHSYGYNFNYSSNFCSKVKHPSLLSPPAMVAWSWR